MSSNQKTKKIVWGVTIGLAASAAVLSAVISVKVLGLLEEVGNQNREQPKQITASEIASIVQDTLEAKERAVSAELMNTALAPWEAARDVKERVYGNPNARFSIVTFSDLECPFCKRFHNTPKEVVDASSDNVSYEFKHLPLDFHNPAALQGSVMAECVAKELGNKYAWAFIDQYFQTTQTNGGGVADLDNFAKRFGLTSSQIAACKTDKNIQARITGDLEFAREAGVSGTPSSYVVDTVGGKSIQIGGAQGAEVFMNAIRSLLEDDKEQSEE